MNRNINHVDNNDIKNSSSNGNRSEFGSNGSSFGSDPSIYIDENVGITISANPNTREHKDSPTASIAESKDGTVMNKNFKNKNENEIKNSNENEKKLSAQKDEKKVSFVLHDLTLAYKDHTKGIVTSDASIIFGNHSLLFIPFLFIFLFLLFFFFVFFVALFSSFFSYRKISSRSSHSSR
jgi:uncharacterized membrane protein YdfJ with MMPL/SSD domain